MEIARARRARRWTIGERAGVSQVTVRSAERGIDGATGTVFEIAAILGVDLFAPPEKLGDLLSRNRDRLALLPRRVREPVVESMTTSEVPTAGTRPQASSRPRHAFVWVWLPGSTEPVVAGRLDDMVAFTDGRSYRARPGRDLPLPPELPLRSEVTRPNAGPSVAGCTDDAGPDLWGQRMISARHAVD